MPVIGAIIGAILSGLFMWLVWGNGMQIIQQWLESRARNAKALKDANAIADARDRAKRAPLRAIEDPREAALILLVHLARLRGELTREQRECISALASGHLGLTERPQHHIALAEFAARQVGNGDEVVSDILPLFYARLSPEEISDLFGMLDELAALHGGPTDAQSAMIERTKKRLERR